MKTPTSVSLQLNSDFTVDEFNSRSSMLKQLLRQKIAPGTGKGSNRKFSYPLFISATVGAIYLKFHTQLE